MPKTLPPHYSIGSKDEAVIYVAQNSDNWSATKGALQRIYKPVRKTKHKKHPVFLRPGNINIISLIIKTNSG